jgi:hypothetical protein
VNDIEDKLVRPFYLKILHGNLVTQVSGREQEMLLEQMRTVIGTITFEDIIYLWTRGWRASLMASWWAAVRRWRRSR